MVKRQGGATFASALPIVLANDSVRLGVQDLVRLAAVSVACAEAVGRPLSWPSILAQPPRASAVQFLRIAAHAGPCLGEVACREAYSYSTVAAPLVEALRALAGRCPKLRVFELSHVTRKDDALGNAFTGSLVAVLPPGTTLRVSTLTLDFDGRLPASSVTPQRAAVFHVVGAAHLAAAAVGAPGVAAAFLSRLRCATLSVSALATDIAAAVAEARAAASATLAHELAWDVQTAPPPEACAAAALRVSAACARTLDAWTPWPNLRSLRCDGVDAPAAGVVIATVGAAARAPAVALLTLPCRLVVRAVRAPGAGVERALAAWLSRPGARLLLAGAGDRDALRSLTERFDVAEAFL